MCVCVCACVSDNKGCKTGGEILMLHDAVARIGSRCKRALSA